MFVNAELPADQPSRLAPLRGLEPHWHEHLTKKASTALHTLQSAQTCRQYMLLEPEAANPAKADEDALDSLLLRLP